MASTLKHLRSSTTNKRPTASGLADGQIAINTASGTPALFFKDNADNIVKVGPVHVGATAPNTSPAGSAGNSTGELWVDDSLTTKGLKYYSGAVFVNLTPSGTTSEAGLVELATNAETQTGSDAVRAVTPAGLQSKVSDSTSTTSSTTIASATAVKSAYDLANAALPKTGGTVTGEIVISPSGSLAFEGSTDDSFETRIVVTDPTADRTITLPNTTGTVITTGDTGTVTSTMIADGAIVNADINASAAIAPSKLGSGALPSGVTVSSTNIVDGTIVNADVNASAAIAGSKISPDFAGQNVVTTGSITGASLIPSSATVPTNGVYLPAANSVGISTNGTQRISIGSDGDINVDSGGVFYDASTNRLAVGTTSPSVTFEVKTTSTTAHTVAAFGSGPISGGLEVTTNGNLDWGFNALNARNLTFSTNQLERLRITSTGQLSHIGGGSSGSPAVGFNGSAPSNSLVIDSTGKVGLGTSAPDELLHIKGDIVEFKGTNTNQIADTAGTEQVFKFGIEGQKNSVYGPAGSIIFRQDASTWSSVDQYNKPTRIEFCTQDVSSSDTSETPRLVISQDGNVGIGTTSPDYLFDCQKTGSQLIRSRTNDTGSGASTGGFLGEYLGGGGGTNTQISIAAGNNYGFLSTLTNSPLLIGTNGTEKLRIDTSGRVLIGTSSNSGGALLQVNDNRIRIASAKTPASATDTGTAGEICWDANYVYVCTATNTWKRSALSTW